MLTIFVSLLFITGTTQGFIDETSCPQGWLSPGNSCVKTFLVAKEFTDAAKECIAEGGLLLSTHSDSLIQDVADTLDLLYGQGLHESTWLVQGEGKNKVVALKRDSQGQYKISSVSPLAAYPFLCTLSHAERRKLLFQQQLVPKGAPKLSGPLPSSIYFHSRQFSEYVAIPCQIDGFPTPQINWYKNNVDMVSASAPNSTYLLSGGTLLVPASAQLAYTTFHCTGTNDKGTVRGPSVLLKPAFLDPFREHRLDVFPLLDGGASIDCQAPAHQPKSLTYVWYQGGSTERITQQDERVFISLDGTLHFSYVLPQDDGKYACSLALSSTSSGQYGPFFRFRVPPSTATDASTRLDGAFPPRIEPAHPQLFPEQPEQGEAVYLECFAYGNPAPNYKWTRADGKRLPRRSTLINYGRILKIENAQPSDQTRYKCTASNAFGVTSGEVTMILRGRPSILVPLSDRLVAPRTKWSLECPLPSSDLSSQVEWLHNSNPIVPLLMAADKRKRITVDHNILTVEKTVASDSGVYECVVTNDVGVVASSCLIVVTESAPEFPTHAMPTKVFAVKGSTLMIPCVYRAIPWGECSWSLGGGPKLSVKGRVRDHNGTLVIENVLEDDSGLFMCTARNHLGKAHAPVHLVVVEKADVRAKTSRIPTSDGLVNVICEVEMNCENTVDCPDPLFDWSLNGRSVKELQTKRVNTKIHMHSHRHIVKQKLDLQMPSSIGSRPGRLACTSIFGGAEVPENNLPSAPIKVTASNVSQNAVDLSWRMPAQHRETRHNEPSVDGFIVEMRTRDDRRWISTPRNQVSKTSSGMEEVRLDKLRPNDFYQFRIRSVEAGTLGEPSAPTDWVSTPPDIPRQGVDNLRWRPLNSDTLLVEWDPIEKEHTSGDHLRYKVEWNEEPPESEGENNEIEEADADAKTKRRFHSLESTHSSAVVRLNASEGCRMVVLSVQPINDVGEGETSTDTVAFVNSRGSIRQVLVDDVYALNSSHVNISWHWKGAGECEVAFAVQIVCSSDSHSTEVLSVSAEYTDWFIGGLRADTLYTCTLTPMDAQGRAGQQVPAPRVRTLIAPPIEAPQIRRLGLKTLENGDYTTIIEWTPVEFRNQTGDVGYKIFVYIAEARSEAVVLEMSDSSLIDRNQPSARLDGLRLMYKYTIQVAAYNVGGLGPPSEPRVIRLGAGASPFSSSSHQYSTTSLILVFILTHAHRFL